MDPGSIVALIGSSANIAKLAFTTIQDLQKIQTTYRDAEYTARGLLTKLGVVSFSLGSLELWGRSISISHQAASDLLLQLELSIQECTRVVTGIVSKLQPPTGEFRARDRARFAWERSTLKECESELDSQMQALQLLLQVAEFTRLNGRTHQTDQLHSAEAKSVFSRAKDVASIYSDETASTYSRRTTSIYDGSEDIDFDFDGIVLNSRVYRAAFAKRETQNRRQATNSHGATELQQDISANIRNILHPPPTKTKAESNTLQQLVLAASKGRYRVFCALFERADNPSSPEQLGTLMETVIDAANPAIVRFIMLNSAATLRHRISDIGSVHYKDESFLTYALKQEDSKFSSEVVSMLLQYGCVALFPHLEMLSQRAHQLETAPRAAEAILDRHSELLKARTEEGHTSLLVCYHAWKNSNQQSEPLRRERCFAFIRVLVKRGASVHEIPTPRGIAFNNFLFYPSILAIACRELDLKTVQEVIRLNSDRSLGICEIEAGRPTVHILEFVDHLDPPETKRRQSVLRSLLAENGVKLNICARETAAGWPAMYVRALCDYSDNTRTNLSFRQGDVIQVFNHLESGWWDGVINGVRRRFPSNYCAITDNPDSNLRRHEEDVEGDTDDELREDLDDTEFDDLDSNSMGRPREALARPTQAHNERRPTDPAAYWIPQATPDGRLFYFNTMTGVSTMELPLEAPTSDHETGSETGSAERIIVYMPETSRPPPEMLLRGLEHEEDEYISESSGES